MKNLKKIVKLHSELLESNPYCYLEFAYTRQTEWMVWICNKPQTDDPNRKVIAKGQGNTIEEAAKNALEGYKTECQNKLISKKNDVINSLKKMITDIESGNIEVLNISARRDSVEVSDHDCDYFLKRFAPANDYFVELHLQNKKLNKET